MQQVKLKVSLLSSKVRISLLMERNSPTSVVITLTSNVFMNLFLQHWLAITAPTQLLSHPYSQFHSSLFHHLVNTWHCNIVSIKAYLLLHSASYVHFMVSEVGSKTSDQLYSV